jgi:hypothetical protein
MLVHALHNDTLSTINDTQEFKQTALSGTEESKVNPWTQQLVLAGISLEYYDGCLDHYKLKACR